MPEVIYQGDLPAFTGRNVPIKEIASAIGKDAQYVRLGIQQGLLKFGTAIKVGSSNELKNEETQFEKRLTKSIDTSVTAFGQAADCISMYSCL